MSASNKLTASNRPPMPDFQYDEFGRGFFERQPAKDIKMKFVKAEGGNEMAALQDHLLELGIGDGAVSGRGSAPANSEHGGTSKWRMWLLHRSGTVPTEGRFPLSHWFLQWWQF